MKGASGVLQFRVYTRVHSGIRSRSRVFFLAFVGCLCVCVLFRVDSPLLGGDGCVTGLEMGKLRASVFAALRAELASAIRHCSLQPAVK